MFIIAGAIVVPLAVRAQTQFEMNQEAHRAADAADKRLNATYQQLLPKLDKESRAELQKAELAWITFRDAQADYEAGWFRGGTMAPMQHSECVRRLTEERIKDLKLYPEN